MKTKFIALALSGALIATPLSIYADPPPREKLIGFDDCIAYLAGAVIIAGIYSCWYHGITTDSTNTIHPVQLWPFGQHRKPPTPGPNSMPALHLSSVVAHAMSDDFGFNVEANITIQSSSNKVDWVPYLDTTVWESPVGHLFFASSNGVPLWTNYTLRGPDGKSTNSCPFLPDMTKPNEFFRLLSH